MGVSRGGVRDHWGALASGEGDNWARGAGCRTSSRSACAGEDQIARNYSEALSPLSQHWTASTASPLNTMEEENRRSVHPSATALVYFSRSLL